MKTTYSNRGLLSSANLRKQADIHNRLKNLAKCFPTLYILKTKDEANFLKIKNPHDYAHSFGILFNKDMLLTYLKKINPFPKRLVALEVFQRKLSMLKWIKTETVITVENFDETFGKLFNLWSTFCGETCFAGWANTPGYLLLSSIDYNSYLNELGLKKEKDNVIGLFIERDQNEMAIFSDTKFKPEIEVYPIFPYDLLKLNASKSYTKFFNLYRKYAGEILNNNFTNAAKFITECVFPYVAFTNSSSETTNWDIDFYKTKCDIYNPHTKILLQTNQSEKTSKPSPNQVKTCENTCKIGVNPTTEAEEVYALDDKNCGLGTHSSEYKSAKYTLKDEENLKYMNEYLILISSYGGGGKEKLVDSCTNFKQSNRTF
jgi:hypothetical protein